eukprot:scaffold142134_cov178-Phaeocystis_antarctica.AAC.1
MLAATRMPTFSVEVFSMLPSVAQSLETAVQPSPWCGSAAMQRRSTSFCCSSVPCCSSKA